MPSYNVTWDEVRHLTHRLLKDVKTSDVPPYRGVVSIGRGGMVPASLMAHALGISDVLMLPLRSFESSGERGAVASYGALPELADGGEGWLIVDDIADTGSTLVETILLYPKAHTLTYYYKASSKVRPNYTGRTVGDDHWLFFPWDPAFNYKQA